MVDSHVEKCNSKWGYWSKHVKESIETKHFIQLIEAHVNNTL